MKKKLFMAGLVSLLVAIIINNTIQNTYASLIYTYTSNQFLYNDNPSLLGSSLGATVIFDDSFAQDYTGEIYLWDGIIRSFTITTFNNSDVALSLSTNEYNSSGYTYAFIDFDDGVIVNWVLNNGISVATGQQHPVFWTIGYTTYSMQSRDGVEMLTERGRNGGVAYINDQPGTWTSNSTSLPVPEPSTLLLLGVGLAGLVGWRRFRG